MMAELLAHGNDRVVRAMSGAMRNLAIDSRNCELLGKDTAGEVVAVTASTLVESDIVFDWPSLR